MGIIYMGMSKVWKEIYTQLSSLINDGGTMWVFATHFSEELAARGYSVEIVIDDNSYDPIMALLWAAWDKEKLILGYYCANTA